MITHFSTAMCRRAYAGINNIFNTREEKDEIVYVEPTVYYAGLSVSY